jgi:2-haloacid dehalogenase
VRWRKYEFTNPIPSVYKLASDRLHPPFERICFLSSNGWDAYSAKAFGFHVVWCNRSHQVPECIPSPPDAQITTLAELPDIVYG